jgi:hypothetical protein
MELYQKITSKKVKALIEGVSVYPTPGPPSYLLIVRSYLKTQGTSQQRMKIESIQIAIFASRFDL